MRCRALFRAVLSVFRQVITSSGSSRHVFPPAAARTLPVPLAGASATCTRWRCAQPRSAAAVLLSPFLQADIAAKVKVVEAAAAGVCGLCSYAPLPASCPAAAEVAVVARRL
jgi:hypothetical protein